MATSQGARQERPIRPTPGAGRGPRQATHASPLRLRAAAERSPSTSRSRTPRQEGNDAESPAAESPSQSSHSTELRRASPDPPRHQPEPGPTPPAEGGKADTDPMPVKQETTEDQAPTPASRLARRRLCHLGLSKQTASTSRLTGFAAATTATSGCLTSAQPCGWIVSQPSRVPASWA